MRAIAWVLAMLGLSAGGAAAEPLKLYAAGSLKAAFGEVAADFEKAGGPAVAATFGASGLLRGRIEGGERADVFASADMAHPLKLAKAGKAGPVALFARNELCALARPGLEVSPATLLDAMLRDGVRLGTSTPKADPSGDYAWKLFGRAEAARPGSFAKLDAKALKLTGGPDTAKAPEGRNTYGWVMGEGKADLFLTYCTNALLAKAEVPDLQVVAVPGNLAVGADYGLTVLNDAPPEAWRLALYVLSPEGQAVLARHGFKVAGVPEG
ncbi:MAG: molybdate ABC transporter substrate-binding protein [Geminicoccaceae bacterium]|nr:molybdate ABC transporter substrate-binding protein [Geminicoccaceae bacterium]